MATGAGKLGFPQNFSHFSHSQAQSILTIFSVTVGKPPSQASPSLGMLSLAALSIVLVLELLDRFENLEIDEFEDFLEIDLDLEIGEIEGLELDPELEGLLWENIVDILSLVNRLEDLQI